MKKMGTILTGLLAAQASLALDLSKLTGPRVETKSPSGLTEICRPVSRFMPGAYKEKDTEDETKLCAYNFYAGVALCPKLESTNPGVLITEIEPGKTREQTIGMCKIGDSLTTEAKFKSSISCSYTPSILAYYHFSKMLKAGNVPAAVFRTMDRAEQKKVIGHAFTLLKSQPGSVISQTWSTFDKVQSKGTNDDIIDSSRKFIFGALVDNPKREEKYSVINGGGGAYELRYQRFMNTDAFKRISNNNSLAAIAGTDMRKALPVIVQMKDMSELILLDTLLSQADRPGNIHYKMAWYVTKNDKTTGALTFERKTSKAKMDASKKWIVPAEEKAIQDSGAIFVPEMLMKDNDCGVDVAKRENMMRKLSILESVRHMSPKTYKKFMDVYKASRSPEFSAWMKNELLFKDADLGKPGVAHPNNFMGNIERAHAVLVKNCKDGSLKLDLDIDLLLPGNLAEPVSCE